MNIEFKKHWWGKTVIIYFKAGKRTLFTQHGSKTYTKIPPTVMVIHFSKILKKLDSKTNGVIVYFGYHHKDKLYQTNLHYSGIEINCGTWIENLRKSRTSFKNASLIALAKDASNKFWQGVFAIDFNKVSVKENIVNIKLYDHVYDIKNNNYFQNFEMNNYFSAEELEQLYLETYIETYVLLCIAAKNNYNDLFYKYYKYENNQHDYKYIIKSFDGNNFELLKFLVKDKNRILGNINCILSNCNINYDNLNKLFNIINNLYNTNLTDVIKNCIGYLAFTTQKNTNYINYLVKYYYLNINSDCSELLPKDDELNYSNYGMPDTDNGKLFRRRLVKLVNTGIKFSKKSNRNLFSFFRRRKDGQKIN